MSDEIDDGGPAFPARGIGKVHLGGPNAEVRWDPVTLGGMSLRDYFAAQAMLGLVSKAVMNSRSWTETAEQAYNAADALLLVRRRER